MKAIAEWLLKLVLALFSAYHAVRKAIQLLKSPPPELGWA